MTAVTVSDVIEARLRPLADMFDSPTFSDVLVLQEARPGAPPAKSFRLHRVVLAACSKTLATVLATEDFSLQQPLLLAGVEPGTLEAVLRFFYTGECCFTLETVASLLDAATKLGVPLLINAAWQYIQRAGVLGPRSLPMLLSQSVALRLDAFTAFLLRYCEKRVWEIISDLAFPQLSQEALAAFLTHHQRALPLQGLLDAANAWCRADPARVDVAHQLLTSQLQSLTPHVKPASAASDALAPQQVLSVSAAGPAPLPTLAGSHDPPPQALGLEGTSLATWAAASNLQAALPQQAALTTVVLPPPPPVTEASVDPPGDSNPTVRAPESATPLPGRSGPSQGFVGHHGAATAGLLGSGAPPICKLEAANGSSVPGQSLRVPAQGGEGGAETSRLPVDMLALAANILAGAAAAAATGAQGAAHKGGGASDGSAGGVQVTAGQRVALPAPRTAAGIAGRMVSGPSPSPRGVCHVDNCFADLSSLRDYHQRFRVCDYHLKVSSLLKDGVPQRFCQQCGRFHPLEEFDGTKRSCRARLQRHNARRRKRVDAGSDDGGAGTLSGSHTAPSRGKGGGAPAPVAKLWGNGAHRKPETASPSASAAYAAPQGGGTGALRGQSLARLLSAGGGPPAAPPPASPEEGGDATAAQPSEGDAALLLSMAGPVADAGPGDGSGREDRTAD